MAKTLAEEIITIIQAHSNDNPAPTTCEVVGNYPDDQYHVDVDTEDGIIRYVPCINDNTIGHQGILIYLNGDLNTPLAIIDQRSDQQ